MKRIVYILLLTIIIENTFIYRCNAVSAESYCVLDAASGRLLYGSNENKRAGMASTTKIITAITAIENAPLESVATVSKNAYGVEGSSMYLVLGEKLSLEDLLYGLMLVSGNDAATAIAEHVGGSVEKFAELMNQTALKIGAYNSHFTNPHGLSDPEHYTTAADLSKITAYALKNPKFCEIVSTKTKSIPWKDHEYNRKLVNHNKFLSMYDGCIGVKTGFTKKTGRCLVTAVEKDGMRLICTTLAAPDDWNDHRDLYNKAFSEYKPHKIKTAGEILAEAEVKNGAQNRIGLMAENDVYVPLKEGESAATETSAEAFEAIEAPIKKGDVLGVLHILKEGTEIGSFPLCAAENVELKRVFFKAETLEMGVMLKKVFLMWLNCFET